MGRTGSEAWDVVVVPDNPATSDDLSVIIDGGLTVPLESVGKSKTVSVEHLDVPDTAIRMLESLQDAGESPVTVTEASEHVDVSKRSVRGYLSSLVEQGVLRREDTPGTSADRFHLR